jgi:hypothetical protein
MIARCGLRTPPTDIDREHEPPCSDHAGSPAATDRGANTLALVGEVDSLPRTVEHAA